MRDAMIPLGPVRFEGTTLPLVRLEGLTKRPPSASVAAAMLRNQDAIMSALAVAADALQPDAPASLRAAALWSVRRVRDLLGEKA